MSVIPYVVEQTVHGERGYDIYSRLLKDRIVFLGGEIDTQVSNLIVAEMLYLTAESGTKDIYLYINSVGGEVTPGMAIYDTMQYINAPVSTICLGQAASLAAILLAAGRKGKRFALPNSRIMIHQPWGGAQGWWIIIREFGSANLFPLRPAARRMAARLAACPRQMVDTGALMYCMVS